MAQQVIVKEMAALVEALGLNETQKLKLQNLALEVQIEHKKAIVEMKPEQFHSIDVAPVGPGNARMTFPVDVTKFFSSRRTNFDVYTIFDKKEIIAFAFAGKFDDLEHPVVLMVPKRSEKE